MNIKKIGLTALAGSMVALSAVAGELTVTGSANMTYSSYAGNQDVSDIKSGIGMENSVWATGSTELDNGFVVSLTQGINASDSTYISVDMGDLGTLEYVQDDSSAGLEKLDDMTPSAYEEVSDGLDGTVQVLLLTLIHTRLQNIRKNLDLVTLTQLVELQFM